MDGTDFIPTTVALEGCDPLANNALAASFWQGSFDQSCESELGADSPRCYVFSSYMWYIDTPFMVVAPFEEIDPGIITCAPEFPSIPDFWSRWRSAMATLAFDLLTVIIDQCCFPYIFYLPRRSIRDDVGRSVSFKLPCMLNSQLVTICDNL